MKSVCLLTRRDGTTREAFRDYYETSHSRLGSRHFPFAKYLRNHLVEASQPVDFDVVSEFYFDDDAAIGGLMDGPVGEILRADERKFMEQSLIRSAAVEERVLAGPPRDVAAPGTRRRMFLLSAPGRPDERFHAAVCAWGESLAGSPGVMRVSADLVNPDIPMSPTPFPYDAVLSLWLDGSEKDGVAAPEPPAGVSLEVALLADVCESPPELLAELYQSQAS